MLPAKAPKQSRPVLRFCCKPFEKTNDLDCKTKAGAADLHLSRRAAKSCMCTAQLASRAGAVRTCTNWWRSAFDSQCHPFLSRRRIAHRGCDRSGACRNASCNASYTSRTSPDARGVCRSPRSSVMVSSKGQSDIELFVLSGRDAPELQELTNLPSGVHLLGTGRPDVELKGTGCRLSTALFGTCMRMPWAVKTRECAQIGQSQNGRR